jgi:heparan-alpha-glucosaminide N-acetyltransferase
MASSTYVTARTAAVSETPIPARLPDQGRIVSLDAYRGLIMLMLISHGFGFSVLQSRPDWAWLARQVEHVEWTGCTFWDLIQPAFTFMVGMAMPFAFARRIAQGATYIDLFRHVVWRSLVLVLLSNVLSNFNSGRGRAELQLINVLCQIAFGYLLCFFITRLRFRWQVACAAGLLAGHWALFALFPGPDGAFSRQGNIGAAIDLRLLGYNYSGYYTTINFVTNAVTILFGCWAGMLMRLDKPHSYKLKILAASCVSAFALGLALEPFNPMVKRLWTASFTFFSAGWVLVFLIALYWIVDIKQYRRWAFPVIVLGMNSIFIYSFSQVLRGWLNRGVGIFTGNFWYFGDLGAIPQNIVVLTLMWSMSYWLYRHRIYIRI